MEKTIIIDGIEFESFGSSLEEILEKLQDPLKVKGTVSQKKYYSGEELYDMGIKTIPTLVEPIIPKYGLAGLIGTSDIGKSTLLLQLCCDLVLNKTFLGFKLNPTHRRAIYVSTEDDQFSISSRLQRFTAKQKTKLESIKFIFDSTELLKSLDDILTKEPVDLVIIDTLSDIYGGEMNQINKVRSFLEGFSNLAIKHKCLFFINHHTSKSAEEKPPHKSNSVGSVGFVDKARFVVELRGDLEKDDLRHLCIVKANGLSASYKKESYELELTSSLEFKNTGNKKPFEDLILTPKRKAKQNTESAGKRVIVLHEAGKTTREISDQLKEEGFDLSKSWVAEFISKNVQKKVPNEGVDTGQKDKKGK